MPCFTSYSCNVLAPYLALVYGVEHTVEFPHRAERVLRCRCKDQRKCCAVQTCS